jgi:hypothetical protein
MSTTMVSFMNTIWSLSRISVAPLLVMVATPVAADAGTHWNIKANDINWVVAGEASILMLRWLTALANAKCARLPNKGQNQDALQPQTRPMPHGLWRAP